MEMPDQSLASLFLEMPTSSTITDDTDEPFKLTKKRRHMEEQTVRVRVVCGDGPADDGYSWRKYGQKDILGAKYPRAYFRCTHRNSQGCTATKQVQRCDEDPTVFDVIYYGTHTCIQSAVAMQPPLEHNPHGSGGSTQ
ncbi:unnamed protein product [Urochloa humidicola]